MELLNEESQARTRHYQETLRRVEENDATLTELNIGGLDNINLLSYGNFHFNSNNSKDYSRLGASIGKNTHLTTLKVTLYEIPSLKNTNKFYDGLKRNTSISELNLGCGNIVDEVAPEILNAYQVNNRYLAQLNIDRADLQNGGDQIVAATLGSCTNLSHVGLPCCSISSEQLLPIVEAIRGLTSLVELNLGGNRIGNGGCEVVATLLSDPISNLHTLNLRRNAIDNEGATILANALLNNTKLRNLFLYDNEIDQSVVDIFSKLLCNTSSINSIYSSNHTLERLVLSVPRDDELDSLLHLNMNTNKSYVAIKKILQNHPYYSNALDMEPFFEWNMEGEGERDLKALPYVIAWFEKTTKAMVDAGMGGTYDIKKRKLTAIYQFAQAMPVLFVPASHIKMDNKKRKRL